MAPPGFVKPKVCCQHPAQAHDQDHQPSATVQQQHLKYHDTSPEPAQEDDIDDQYYESPQAKSLKSTQADSSCTKPPIMDSTGHRDKQHMLRRRRRMHTQGDFSGRKLFEDGDDELPNDSIAPVVYYNRRSYLPDDVQRKVKKQEQSPDHDNLICSDMANERSQLGPPSPTGKTDSTVVNTEHQASTSCAQTDIQ